jgi:hypothetical protein
VRGEDTDREVVGIIDTMMMMEIEDLQIKSIFLKKIERKVEEILMNLRCVRF